jgi:hypothetical protein
MNTDKHRLLLVLLLFLAAGTVFAQEYQKDVFLEFATSPCGEYGVYLGPNAIGLDNEGHFCVQDTSWIMIFDDQGRLLRQFKLQSERWIRIGIDFCFDPEGSIYSYRESGKDPGIHKFDAQGRYASLMGCLLTRDFARRREVFLGRNIAYVKGYGLMLYFSRTMGHIPVTYRAGVDSNLVSPDRVVDNFRTSANSFVKVNFDDKGHHALEFCTEGQPTKEVQIVHNGFVTIIPLFSLDEESQYFYMALADSGSTTAWTEEIRKYHDGELIFTTGPIPPNHLEYEGKQAVVDSHGTIYYYAGDEKKIQILRWRLN